VEWLVHTHVPVAFPPGCILMAVGGEPGKDRPAGADPVQVLSRLIDRQGLDSGSFKLRKMDTGKPFGLVNGENIGIGISHCSSLLVCGIHTSGEIGLDVEPAGRTLHPRLRERICHPEEEEMLPDDLCCIRMWTIKEAALKFLGTGLRLAMSKIRLDMLDENRFRAETGVDTLEIFSFLFREHWIAVALKEKENQEV